MLSACNGLILFACSRVFDLHALGLSLLSISASLLFTIFYYQLLDQLTSHLNFIKTFSKRYCDHQKGENMDILWIQNRKNGTQNEKMNL